jgi:nucleoside-diphosphate-sugar epimerase
MTRRIFLTGANGFIGSHVLAKLLDSGFNVCCAVRTTEKGDNILRDFAAQKAQVSIAIVPDIVAPEAYNKAVQGSPPFDTVFHTASPFTYKDVSSNLEFLEPAIKGTMTLLKAVKQHAPSVKRVIWTGSCASVVDYDNLTSNPPKVLTEKDWNPVTWEEAVHGDPSKGYRASKLYAEREGTKSAISLLAKAYLYSMDLYERGKASLRLGDSLSAGDVRPSASLHLQHR